MTDVSVIFVSYNTAEMTKRALDCLYTAEQQLRMEVFVIDNASRDHSVAAIKTAYPHIPLIENKINVGFGRANNQALPMLTGRYVLLLNTDAFVNADTLTETIAYMDAHKNCGILGVKLIGEDNILQPSCRYFPTPLNQFLHTTGLSRFFPSVKMVDEMDWPHDTIRSCDWVPGCYYLIRREVIDQVGLFDPLYFMYCEEVDHCFATKKAGWDIVYYPISVVHLGGQSAKTDSEISAQGRQIKSLQIESELLYYRKNHGLLGLFSHLLLQNIADVMDVLKSILKLRSPKRIMSYFKHAFAIWQTLFKTQFATKSTR